MQSFLDRFRFESISNLLLSSNPSMRYLCSTTMVWWRWSLSFWVLMSCCFWPRPVDAFSIASSSSSSSSPPSPSSSATTGLMKNQFLNSECDDNNVPPSLSIVARSIRQLESGSDVRGQFVEHPRVGSITNVAHAIASRAGTQKLAPLTPFAAHCLGFAFATLIRQQQQQQKRQQAESQQNTDNVATIAIGQDPREHGARLADAFCRGALSVDGVRVVYTGIATTPAMFEFCRAGLCDAGVMVTASHLPSDRNGFKFFDRRQGGYTKPQIQQLCLMASQHVNRWQDAGILPPSSGKEAVFCSEWVDFMPHYASTLQQAIVRETGSDKPLEGLRIILNAGHGSGGFFQKVLHNLGADVSASVHLEPDSSFPAGVPNPEYAAMIDLTTRVCESSNSHLGIMLDTDADRCGFVVPRTVSPDGTSCSNYEVLNRNRLIAVLAVIFSQASPGCAVVTDSVTSEGLAKFLTQTLGLQHIRYLKGYANVIAKAKEVTESGQTNAEMAIETSGHCAMKENGYLDDGTYTAVKVVGLLARITRDSPGRSLLDLITDLEELDHVKEVRIKAVDGSLETTSVMFDYCALEIERVARTKTENNNSNNNNNVDGEHDTSATAMWQVDEENLEGIRIRTGPNGGFFMLRKSLHDPLVSLQVEAASWQEARKVVIDPLLQLFGSEPQISSALDFSVLENY